VTVTAESWDPEWFRAHVQQILDDYLDSQASLLADLGDDAGRLTRAARLAVQGGKRFRAMLCLWGFRAVREFTDPVEEQAVLRAASALELLHSSALVHDDYMDASDTRRGRPSVHRAFADEARGAGWPGHHEHYGAAAAILLGDLLLAWADELLRSCGMPQDQVLAALEVFDVTRTEVIAGQFLDVSVQARGESDIDQAMRVLRYKSAKYSVERPLHVGATLAGADKETVAALTGFGVPLGEAFQLRDDLLGVFGDPAVTGKPAGDDLSEGKRTVLVALALRDADPADATKLATSLGQQLPGAEVAELQRIIERSGAHGEVEERIERLTAQALTTLDAAPFTHDGRSVLRGLAEAATQRVV
jgi:geranylgeranyl diphosphate synthase, type I